MAVSIYVVPKGGKFNTGLLRVATFISPSFTISSLRMKNSDIIQSADRLREGSALAVYLKCIKLE